MHVNLILHVACLRVCKQKKRKKGQVYVRPNTQSDPIKPNVKFKLKTVGSSNLFCVFMSSVTTYTNEHRPTFNVHT